MFSAIININSAHPTLTCIERTLPYFQDILFWQKSKALSMHQHKHTLACSHTRAADPSTVTHVFSGGSFWSFYFILQKNKHTVSRLRTPKRQCWSSLSGLMVLLKSFGSGRVIIPLCYKADLLKVIAQLISAVKYCIYIEVCS